MINESLYRGNIAEGVRQVRIQRHLTQEDFAKLLKLSQSQFSKIENAQSSISAEHLLFLLQHFNLPLSHFLKNKDSSDEKLALQNALVRFGAKQLLENSNVIVPEKYDHVSTVIFESLAIYPLARFIVSLAPVLVRHFNKINFNQVGNKLFEQYNSENRLWWLVESTLRSVQNRLNKNDIGYRRLESLYHKCQVPLLARLQYRKNKFPIDESKFQNLSEDFLDEIFSEKTKQVLINQRDQLAAEWKIVTEIKQSDFDEALLGAEEYD